MKKILLQGLFLIVFKICPEQSVFSQLTLKDIKKNSDSLIRNIFSKKVVKEIKFIDHGLGGTKYEGKDFESIQNDTLRGVYQFFMTYDIYSKELDYLFRFDVVLDNKGNALNRSEITKSIPRCVRYRKKCEFISQEKAKLIAIKDTIQFNDNLKAELFCPENSDNFFWIVSGQDKKLIDYSKDIERNYYPLLRGNTRYINARTGKIMGFDEFQLLDKSEPISIDKIREEMKKVGKDQ